MALTTEELKARDTAKLQALVAQLTAAVRADSTSQLDQALDAIVAFSTRTPFPELQLRAAKSQSAASRTMSEEALRELAEIADGLATAGAGFKAAAMVAENGKKELLFPALAGAAEQGLELVKEFQRAVETVRANVGGIESLGDVPEALSQLRDAFNSLKEKVEAVNA